MDFFSRPAVSVLFVCTANICRSPMAEAVLREELKLARLHRRVSIDSAGTNATQPGHPSDGRARQVCAREGIDLRKSRARQVVDQDFSRFDYLLALDSSNRDWLRGACPREHIERISLLGDWARPTPVGDIPDPYYGSMTGFEEVLALLHRSIDGFLVHLTDRLQ